MSIASTAVTTAPSVAGAVYTSSGATAITTAYFCNPTNNTIVCNIFLVGSGGVASGTNVIYSNVQIAAQDTLVIERERLLLNSGDSLRSNAAPAGLGCSVSYTEI